MVQFERLKRKRLGDILVDEGFVEKEAMIAALHEQQRSGRLLSDVLLDAQEISDYDLARVLVQEFQVPYVDLMHYNVHKDLVEKFPPELLRTGGVLPLDRFGNQVAFACQEVPDYDFLEKLKPIATGGAHFYAALASEIRLKLNGLLPEEKAEETAETAPIPAESMAKDSSWKEIFDVANKAILDDIDIDDDIDTDED